MLGLSGEKYKFYDPFIEGYRIPRIRIAQHLDVLSDFSLDAYEKILWNSESSLILSL